MRVFNVYGQLVESIQLHKSSYLFSAEINLSKLSNGFYFLAIEFDEQTIVKPFVVK